VKALAWPGAVVTALLVVRRPLLRLIPTIRHFKYGSLELDFERGLEEAEQKAEAAQLPPPTPSPAALAGGLDPRLLAPQVVARAYPRAAVLEAWLLVEDALQRAALQRGLGSIRNFTRKQLEHLVQQGVLPEEAVGLVEQLRRLRNEAAHAVDFAPTPEQAQHYTELAERLVKLVEQRTRSAMPPP